MVQVRRHLRRRWARWRADAHYRRLFRQQLWQQRRARLRWEVRRARVEQRGRWQHRSILLSRQASNLRDLGSDVGTTVHDQVAAGSRRVAPRLTSAARRLAAAGRTLATAAGLLARGLVRASRWLARGLVRASRRLSATLSGRRPSRRLVVTTAVVLLGSVASYAAIRSVGDLGDLVPNADGTARPAADHSGDRASLPGLGRPGIFVSMGVTDAGRLEVSERARTGRAIAELSITPPPALDGAKRLPQLEDVRVTADGQPVEVPSTVEVTTVVVLDRPATVIELRYRVVGASARSKPATPGRATLSLRPALATTLGGSRTVIELHGTKVHTLVCVDLPPKRQLCGIKRDGGWRTQRIDTASSAVVALVDLPDRAA